MRFHGSRSGTLLVGCLLILLLNCCAFGQTLRIASWNIEDDINGNTTPLPGLGTVLLGVGNGTFGGDKARPLDILGLEETTSNSVTVAPIVSTLNTDYPGANYVTTSGVAGTGIAAFQATDSGGSNDGNGPNSIIYNANTVTLLAAVGVGTVGGSSSGEYRQVARYEFLPVGGVTPFYMYVAHSKSGTGTTNATYRGEEASYVRADEAMLPANSSVLYTGDLNSAPPEAEFSNYGSTSFPNSSGAGYDPVNFSTSLAYYSESSTDLRYRDDYQLMTNNVLTDKGAINYVANSLTNFGNNGTTPLYGDVNSSSNTALNYMVNDSPSESAIYSAEDTASDHLPVVADYTFLTAAPEPGSLISLSVAVGIALTRRRRSSTASV